MNLSPDANRTPGDAVVRPARPEDTPAIHALIARVFADYDYILDVVQEDAHLRDPGPYFRSSGGEFWVVEQDGRIIATCAVHLHPEAGELKSLYVAHEHRRRGWGRRLTQMTIEHARRAGRPRMFLWSDTRFVEAHRLYESLGFVRSGLREIRSTNSFSEYRYEREL